MNVGIRSNMQLISRLKIILLLKWVNAGMCLHSYIEKGRGMNDASRTMENGQREGRAGRYDKLDSTGSGPCACMTRFGRLICSD